jgi:hypothetical protein
MAALATVQVQSGHRVVRSGDETMPAPSGRGGQHARFAQASGCLVGLPGGQGCRRTASTGRIEPGLTAMGLTKPPLGWGGRVFAIG